MPVSFDEITVLIRGAGDLATGVAARLWRCGLPVVMTELPRPLTIRRGVAFSEAVYQGETTVEGIRARRVASVPEVPTCWAEGIVPVLVDPAGECVVALRPRVVVDAILAKRNLGTRRSQAELVIGLGPGFTAGADVHAVVETQRGHNLGRVLWTGTAAPNTGLPGDVGGAGAQRVVRAPADGVFIARRSIGDAVRTGDTLGSVGPAPVLAPIAGVVRGLIHDGLDVSAGLKIGDVDPRGIADYCWTISDKALAIGGGVLEATLMRMRRAPAPASEGECPAT
jgi:xanthine dehydrogenase accessory factor